MILNDRPLAIIFYNGGSCGDLLKSLCLSQIDDRYDLSMTDIGKVVVDQRFKFSLDALHGPYDGPAELIECAHKCDQAVVDYFKNTRLFWIRMPREFNVASAHVVFKKIGIADPHDWRHKLPYWFEMAEEKFGKKIETNADMLEARIVELNVYDQEMVELASTSGIEELSFIDIIHPRTCAMVVKRVIGSSMRCVEKFYRQHWQWRQRNRWFLDMIENGDELC